MGWIHVHCSCRDVALVALKVIRDFNVNLYPRLFNPTECDPYCDTCGWRVDVRGHDPAEACGLAIAAIAEIEAIEGKFLSDSERNW